VATGSWSRHVDGWRCGEAECARDDPVKLGLVASLAPPPLGDQQIRLGLSPYNLACEGCGTRPLVWSEAGAKLHPRHKQCTCVTCGIEFTTTRTDAKFCSNACRQKAHRRAQATDTALKTTATGRRVRS
jgi:hypothetical protein